MTVEADIVTALQSLFPGGQVARVYPDLAPEGAIVPGGTAPYAVYQQVGGEAKSFLERALPSKKNGRIQIAVWAQTRALANALGLQVEQRMVAATAFQAIPLGAAVSDYDEDTKLRGSRQDFSIWSER